jgi:hypothetical protein
MSKKLKPVSKTEYNEAVAQAELIDLRLIASSWSIDLSLLDEIDRLEKRIDQSIVGEPHFDAENGMLMGQVTCKLFIPVHGTPEESDNEGASEESNSVVACNSTYVVVFRVPETLSLGDARRFFASTSSFAVWPYFRTHVANLASQSRVELPPLPLKTLLQRVPEEK